MPDACFVTPSFSRDRQRCELLVRSRELLAPDIDHFIIVDALDLPSFKKLASTRTHIVDSRELMDREFFPVPFMKGWWQSLATMPIRGWITQQIRKLAIGKIANHDLIINVDSDVVLLKEFTPSIFVNDRGQTALFSVDYRNEHICGWSETAAQLLGANTIAAPRNYVGMMIPWKRTLLQDLLKRVESKAGCPWQRAIARLRTFSEYQLYGHFVEELIGLDQAHSFIFTREIVKTSWDHPVKDDTSLRKFFGNLSASHIAAMVHSKDEICSSLYQAYVEDVWDGRHR